MASPAAVRLSLPILRAILGESISAVSLRSTSMVCSCWPSESGLRLWRGGSATTSTSSSMDTDRERLLPLPEEPRREKLGMIVAEALDGSAAGNALLPGSRAALPSRLLGSQSTTALPAMLSK